MFAISTENGLPISDPSLFTFSAYQIKYKRTNMNNVLDFKIVDNRKLEIGRCDIIDFSFNFDMLVSNYPFSCIKNETLEIEGDIDQESISEILILASFCSNETSNISCQGKEEQIKFLTNQRKTVNMLFLHFNEDAINYENPIVEVVNYESFDLTLEKQTKGLMYLMQSIFTSISGIDGRKDQSVERLKKDEIKYQFVSLLPFDEAFFYFSIHSSKKIEKITRTYQTFSEALAGVLGIVNMAIFFLSLLIAKINRFFFKIALLNTLFDFIGIAQKKEEKKLDGGTIGLAPKMKNRREKIHLSMYEAGIFWVKGWLGWKTTERERVHESMERVFVRETSLDYILMRQQQIEKICLMLFSQKERRFIEGKPIFGVEGGKGGKKEKKKSEEKGRADEGGKAEEGGEREKVGEGGVGEEGGGKGVGERRVKLVEATELKKIVEVTNEKKDTEEMKKEERKERDEEVLIELMEFEAGGKGTTRFLNRDIFHTVE